MKAIEVEAIINSDGQLVAQLPEGFVAGQQRVVIVLPDVKTNADNDGFDPEEETDTPSVKRVQPKLTFSNHQVVFPEWDTFRREDMYGDDMR